LPDILAALGRSQLKRLDDFIAARRAIAAQYDAAFSGLPHLKLVQEKPEQRARSGHHLYVIDLDFKALGQSRKQVMEQLKEEGIGSQVHYIPVHKQPYYQERLEKDELSFPVAESFYDRCLSLPCYPDLQEDDIKRVIAAITTLTQK